MDLFLASLLPWKEQPLPYQEVPFGVGGWNKATSGLKEVRKGRSVGVTGNGHSGTENATRDVLLKN